MMVTIGMNYKVLPGKGEVFERAFKEVLEVMKKGAGHTESHLYTDVNEGDSYLIISEWSDKAAFDTFIKSEAFTRVTNWGKEMILAGRPKHQVYTSQS
jgi:heme-degrading monooxygenase HmoA